MTKIYELNVAGKIAYVLENPNDLSQVAVFDADGGYHDWMNDGQGMQYWKQTGVPDKSWPKSKAAKTSSN